MLNYAMIVRQATEGEIGNAIKQIETMQSIDEKYRAAFFFHPENAIQAIRRCKQTQERRANTREADVGFRLGEYYFEYSYSYHEARKYDYYTATVRCNGERITMADISNIKHYLFEVATPGALNYDPSFTTKRTPKELNTHARALHRGHTGDFSCFNNGELFELYKLCVEEAKANHPNMIYALEVYDEIARRKDVKGISLLRLYNDLLIGKQAIEYYIDN